MKNRVLRTGFLFAAPFFMMAFSVYASLSWEFDTSLGGIERRVGALDVEDLMVPIKRTFSVTTVRSPFAVPGYGVASEDVKATVKEEKDLKVALVVISERRALAVVNGSLVGPGDFINGVRVVKIEENRVLFAGRRLFWGYLEE